MAFSDILKFCFKYLDVNDILYGIVDNNWYFMIENLKLIF